MDTLIVRPPIPHLTDAYHNARKSYTFAAGVMLAWELVGIELPESFYGMKILSPGAVPYILMVTTSYFFFRTAIEWHQTDIERRTVLAARLDYILANTIAATAFVVFAVQRTLQGQLFRVLIDQVGGNPVPGLRGVLVTVISLLFALTFFGHFRSEFST